ncbi:MAG: hypothetical protein HYY25_08650 [Candidatus Wallbacteria bacterium]|nr:hypothetical protein [Candidatus Wallbacteria bacterium]MBI4869397.1 hypothetical protein [Candidatus Wallbacteria bacterium]
MSETSFTQRYRDEIASACLGYGYGILNCACAIFWVKAVTERDLLLLAVMAITAVPAGVCYNTMLAHVELMGKDDGERKQRYEGFFRGANWVGFVQFAMLFKLFLLG